ncbi:MAG: Gfo/Idh/MocA family oxidoreductase, partial [Chloroflexota bacterium]
MQINPIQPPENSKIHNFAAIGVAGYIAPRHLKAIRDTGSRLVAAVDPNDSVGMLDQFSFDVRFFTEIERFDRHLEKLRRGPEENRVHYVSVMSPNYLHDAHCRLAMRTGADVICEKPLVINPWNLDQLSAIEAETGRRINTVLQLRVHPALLKLKERLDQDPPETVHDVVLSYVTSRGLWYHTSWKGVLDKSGGVATNIGIHLFDLLIWLFGPVQEVCVHAGDPQRMSGFLSLQRARVRWFLSVDHHDLPFQPAPGKAATFRSITIDGSEVEFSEGFTDLHTTVYQRTLCGQGFGIED